MVEGETRTEPVGTGRVRQCNFSLWWPHRNLARRFRRQLHLFGTGTP